MNDNDLNDLKRIDYHILTPLVHRALQYNVVELINWQLSNLSTGRVKVYRFDGTAYNKGRPIPWAIILKIVRSWGYGDTEITHPTYWKREVLAYQSGLLNKLKGGLSAPRCYDVMELDNDKVWLWLEDVSDACEYPWSSDCYSLAAYHLGCFNGAYTDEIAIPTYPWLSKDFVQRTSSPTIPTLEQPTNLGHHSFVSATQIADANSKLTFIWQKREFLLNRLASLPEIFCHRDAARRNLYICADTNGESKLGAIDWTIAGRGVIGEEIATLIVTSCLLSEVAYVDLPDLEHLVLNRYIAGLKDVGWSEKSELVVQGYAIVVLLRFCPIIAKQINSHFSTGNFEKGEQQMFLLHFLLEKANEVLKLL